MDNTVSFFSSEKLILFAWNQRRKLVIICIIAMLGSTVISFVLPKKYKATTVLFATQNNNISRMLLMAQPWEARDYLAFGEEINNEQMLQVLKSDAEMFGLANKFDLIDYYGLTNYKNKYFVFRGWYNDLFEYDLTEFQSVQITVYDHDPVMAAKLANGAAEVADSLYRVIIKQRSQVAYAITKEQYDSALVLSNKMEDSMNYYRNQGLLSYDFQVKELTKGYADAVIKGNAATVKQMDERLSPFKVFAKGYNSLYNRLLTHYKYIEQLKESYINAKVNAEKYIPPFFTASKAVPPDKNSYPIKWLVVAGSTLSAFFLGLILLMIISKISSIKE